MLFTHSFATQESLDRARFWLTWHGFQVQDPPRAVAEGVLAGRPKLTVRVDLARSAAAHALIDSIEHSDPDPDPASSVLVRRWVVDGPAPEDGVAATSRPHGSPIHWEARPQGDGAAGASSAARVAEYMFSRWE